MRFVEDKQFKNGQVPIGEIQFNPKSRDDIPATLIRIQRLYCDDGARTKLFEVLEEQLLPGTDMRRGRPGMLLWRIFVLGVLKMAIHCTFDRLGSLADRHSNVRKMLGHMDFGDNQKYPVEILVDNVSLLTEDVLERINEVVLPFGHRVL